MKAAPRQRKHLQALGVIPRQFLNAKVRGRRSGLREGARLRALAAEGSVADLAHRLYPQEETRDDLELEQRIVSACVKDLAGFARYLGGGRRALYRALLDRYAVQNVKVLLRLWGGQENGERAAGHLVPLPARLFKPVDDLSSSPSIEVFLQRIPLPSVRECALAALPLVQETNRRAYLEMAFDQGYWRGVCRAMESVHAGGGARWSRPVRRELAALRLLAALRASRVYDMPWEHVERLLPRGTGEISDEQLRSVHADPEARHPAQAVPWLRRLEPDPERAGDTGYLEDLLWRDVVRLANRQYYTSPCSFGTLISYYYLKRHEFRRLLSLSQMLRYGTGAGRIADHLGLPASGSVPG